MSDNQGAEGDESAFVSVLVDHFLLRSFFIMDNATAAEQKEEDDHEQMIVYFYPPEVLPALCSFLWILLYFLAPFIFLNYRIKKKKKSYE